MALCFQNVLAGDFLRAVLECGEYEEHWDGFYRAVLSELGLEPGEGGWTEDYFQRKIKKLNDELFMSDGKPLKVPRRNQPSTYKDVLLEAGLIKEKKHTPLPPIP